MLYQSFYKWVRKLMIENEMSTSDIANALGESQANIIGKINRETIRLMDAERILDVLGYELGLISKNSRDVLTDSNSEYWKAKHSIDNMIRETEGKYINEQRKERERLTNSEKTYPSEWAELQDAALNGSMTENQKQRLAELFFKSIGKDISKYTNKD